MQRTVFPDDQWARLHERLAQNRSTVRETAVRLEAARRKSQEWMDRIGRLRAESVRQRAAFAEFRATLHASRPAATAPAPVLPRYRPAERDPFDEVRKSL